MTASTRLTITMIAGIVLVVLGALILLLAVGDDDEPSVDAARSLPTPTATGDEPTATSETATATATAPTATAAASSDPTATATESDDQGPTPAPTSAAVPTPTTTAPAPDADDDIADTPIQPTPFNSQIAASTELTVSEPSGLAWSATRNALWVVSDSATAISLIGTDGTKQFGTSIATGSADWEGITELPDGQLAVVSETRRRIVIIDPDAGLATDTISLTDLADDELNQRLDAGGPNKGLEAITVAADGSVWVAKEAEPLLLIELTPDLTAIQRWTDPTQALSSASGLDPDDLDLSALAADPTNPNLLWIGSHKAATIFTWNTETNTVLNTYPIDTPKLEGLTFTPDQRSFAVDDRTGELLTFTTN